MSRVEARNNTITPFTIVLSLVLALALVGSGVLSSVAYAENGPTTEKTTEGSETTNSDNATGSNNGTTTSSNSLKGKEEVVYGTLSTDGKVENIYVVNQFALEKAGTVTDYGKYESLTNLTSTEDISYDGEKMSVAADKGEFYYEGVLTSSDLPWDFTLSYKLDGKAITASELAGKSGKLEIDFTSKKNNKVDATFYDNYMLQITFTLDSELFTNIKAQDSTMANAGKSKTVVFTLLPGGDANYRITADVTDCEMSGVTIAGMPYSMDIDMPDTDELLGEMSTLTDAISALNEGVGKLASGSATLSNGTGDLVDGSATFKDGLDKLGSNSSTITEGSSKINSALKTIASSMEGSEGIDLSSFSELADALTQVSDGLTAMAGGLEELRDGYGSAYNALDGAIAGIPASETVDWNTLYANVTDPAAQQELAKLQEYYTAALTVHGTYYGGAQDAFLGVTSTLNTLTDSSSENSLYGIAGGLSAMASGIETAVENMDTSQLEELAAGLKELSEQYNTFHEGLTQYDEGVSAAATGYDSLHGGLVKLQSGTKDLADGVQELYGGSSQLNEGMQSLPEEMQKQIDELMSDYMPSDFDTISFVSSKNKDVELVQFVIMSNAIEIPAEEEEEVIEEPEPSIWDQFLNLFS